MKNLIRLVKTLNTKEIQLIKRMHKDSMGPESKGNMCMKLFNSILSNQVTSNKDACELICPNKHNSTISQVKKRLELDIMNTMLISSLTSERDHIRKTDISCHKNLLLGNVLIERGLHDEAIQLLHMTSIEAGRAEFHEIKIKCDDLLMSACREYDTKKSYAQYKESMESSLESISSLFHAKSMNYPFLNGSLSDTGIDNGLDLKKISACIRNSTSKKAVSWYKMAIVHYFIQRKEYSEANKHALELLNSTRLRGDMTTYELSEFYQQLSRIMIFLGENMAAIQAAGCCLENSVRGGVEVTPSSQMLFRAYLFSGNIKKAGEIADKALKYLDNSGDPNGGIWYLFKSAFFFIQNMFKESHQILVSQEQHFNGNLPQKTFAKFFELINILELGDLQWFEYKAESFRKRMERIDLKEMDRIKQLYDLLKIAANKSFTDFRYSSDRFSPSLAFFDSHPTQWDPLGYEVINLGDWIRKQI
jgi:hypothetical protein